MAYRPPGPPSLPQTMRPHLTIPLTIRIERAADGTLKAWALPRTRNSRQLLSGRQFTSVDTAKTFISNSLQRNRWNRLVQFQFTWQIKEPTR